MNRADILDDLMGGMSFLSLIIKKLSKHTKFSVVNYSIVIIALSVMVHTTQVSETDPRPFLIALAAVTVLGVAGTVNHMFKLKKLMNMFKEFYGYHQAYLNEADKINDAFDKKTIECIQRVADYLLRNKYAHQAKKTD